MKTGYDFYFDTEYGLLLLPITPSALKIKNGSRNSKVTLISGAEINILKSPSLSEVEFEARFPMREYPFTKELKQFQAYFDVFRKLKENKKPFRFIVARKDFGGNDSFDTNMLVSFEQLTTNEDARNGDDVIIGFSLKQYREYGVEKKKKEGGTGNRSDSTSTADQPRKAKDVPQQSYTVKSGDCLWNIAKKLYGDGSKWKKIYDANKSAIEAVAKAHGKRSSSNGHWIYPGTALTIPAKEAA